MHRGSFSYFTLDNLEAAELPLLDGLGDIIREDFRQSPRVRRDIEDLSSEPDRVPDAHGDWIYADGSHSYRGALKDLQVAAKKIKPGGTLALNDCAPWSVGEAIHNGVLTLVSRLLNDTQDMTGVALIANGHFDVTLRRQLPSPSSAQRSQVFMLTRS